VSAALPPGAGRPADSQAAGPAGDDAGRSAWSRLWQTGVLHSCARGFADNYAGEIAQFWQQQVHKLPDGARVVDIGTGNGALPLLASQVAAQAGRQLDIHGVDSAGIDPAAAAGERASAYRGLSFHPHTPAHRLPFDAGSVALVTSQYAFEYMPLLPVRDELLRVLAADGTIAMIVHSDDSIIARQAPGQAEACRFLFDELALFERSRALLQVLVGASGPDGSADLAALAGNPAAEAARAGFNAAAGRLSQRLSHTPVDLLGRATAHLRNVLAASGQSPAQALELLDRAEQSLLDERERLRQLQAAIQNDAGRQRIAAAFRDHGLAVTLAPLDVRPPAAAASRAGQATPATVRMGWSLVARRA